jgi:hypothetical protein
MLEMASSYALGVLRPLEATALAAHVGEGCHICQRELDGFARLVGPLGYAAPPTRPRAEVRAQLLSRLRAEAGATIIRSTEGTCEIADVQGIRLDFLKGGRCGEPVHHSNIYRIAAAMTTAMPRINAATTMATAGLRCVVSSSLTDHGVMSSYT